MPQATDLILKNGAGVDKTFQLAAPAAGTQPGVWFLREGSTPAGFPSVEISSRRTGAVGNDRRVLISLIVPVMGTNPTTGAQTRISSMPIKIDAKVPELVPDAARDDAIAYIGSAVADALIKATMKTGYAPT
jgi:hypothetical protein